MPISSEGNVGFTTDYTPCGRARSEKNSSFGNRCWQSLNTSSGPERMREVFSLEKFSASWMPDLYLDFDGLNSHISSEK